MTYKPDFKAADYYDPEYDEYEPEEYLKEGDRFITDKTYLERVNGNLNSPDSHADDACDLLEDLIELVQKHNPNATFKPEDFKEVLSPLFALACPQYIAVLAAWNSRKTDEEVEEFAVESHIDTLVNYL